MTDTAPAIRRTLTSYAELEAATQTVVALAARRLMIFDGRLARTWDTSARLDAIRALALASPRHEVRIVVHDAEALRRDCPRVMALATRFAHVIAFRETRPEARHAKDAMVVADTRHFVHRFHEGSPRAGHGLDDPEAATALADRFEELWEASDPFGAGMTLGL